MKRKRTIEEMNDIEDESLTTTSASKAFMCCLRPVLCCCCVAGGLDNCQNSLTALTFTCDVSQSGEQSDKCQLLMGD
jgi:hypothetical protein